MYDEERKKRDENVMVGTKRRLKSHMVGPSLNSQVGLAHHMVGLVGTAPGRIASYVYSLSS